jgi:uncharacterized protein (TIGR03067 family)
LRPFRFQPVGGFFHLEVREEIVALALGRAHRELAPERDVLGVLHQPSTARTIGQRGFTGGLAIQSAQARGRAVVRPGKADYWQGRYVMRVVPGLITCVVVILVVAGCGKRTDSKDGKGSATKADNERDLADIRGVWAVVSSEQDGSKLPENGSDVAAEVEFSGDKMITRIAGKKDDELRFNLDGGKEPKWIDLLDEKGRREKGIYSLTGDSLKLCIAMRRRAPRPDGFSAAAGSKNTMMVLKRKK